MDKEIQIPVVAVEAREMSITSPDDMKRAVELLSNLNKLMDEVEEKKTKLTAPLNAALKEIRSRYKPIEEHLGLAIGSIRLKMTKYQGDIVLAQRKEEEAIAKRIGVGAGHIKMETALKKLDAVEKAEKSVAGDAGSVVFVEVEKFEVTDLSKLPIEYHLADEVKIRKAMKEGVKLEGVRYFTEQSVRNSR